MSDMSHLYKAYAAVHSTEARENLNEVRDEISEMTLTQLTDSDLQEVAEEIIERLFFEMKLSAPEAEGLVECALAEAASKGDISPIRSDKITRLEEAFVSAFDRVNENAPTNAVEGFNEYRFRKGVNENREDRMSVDRGNVKLHNSLIAEDRRVIKEGLLSMFEASYEDFDTKKTQTPKDNRKIVTRADIRGGTRAAKELAKGNPNYKAADHLKSESVEADEYIDTVSKVKKAELEADKARWDVKSEGYKPDPVEKRKKKAADLYKRETLAQDTPAKYKTDKTEDPDKLYRRRMAVDSKTKMKKEDVEFVDNLIESGKFSDEEIEKIVEVQVSRNNPEGV